ncbi:T9SS type A sorting domain-containing protein [Hymenobacter busanensis]|uniref:T9SS type A sorting domain-containing protein n=1 Tax=Hymenobacter busanensis TaxID=2607656 RepID=A0A7L4ZU14_9BACT|nr:LamG-like jellyroll fold domain-containing protein [Hymenobacter busanensis]KAA9339355.1 T9SS type A sorting domain-containing protein [Hymenobacter busanensis]QHJ06884.1 T9SS type A sorting domain-containing protein [Hymenobacter busanensis]
MRKTYLLLGLLSSWAYTAQAQCSAPTVASDGTASVCNGQVSLRTALGSSPVRYVSSVLRFSSEYNNGSWAANQVVGTPDVYPRYGDLGGAWASSPADGTREYLVLRFANPAPAKRILIWETYNPGAIDTIFVRNPNTNAWVPVYTHTAASAGTNSRILNVNFPQTAFAVQDVRLAINSAAVSGWNEIDAVALSNESATFQWAYNGADLPATTAGADGPGLSNITTTGAYSVRLTNDAACTATSAPFNVVSDVAPLLTVTPSNTTICAGGSTTLNASVSNANALMPGRGLRFDGTDDQARVPASASLDLTTALTIEAWINPTGTGNSVQNVVNKSSGVQNTGYIFPRTDDNFNNLVLYLWIGGWRTFPVPYASLRNAWHHTAATYDGSRVKIFIDGVKVLDNPLTGPVATNTNALTLGTQPGFGEFYNGQADEIRLWNVARSEAQILADYNKTVLATQPGLVAYYRLDEGTGTAFVDQTANGNNGTLGAAGAAPTWVTSTAPIRQGIVYTWSPATGLSATTGASVTANPAASTTYTVRATNVNSGCFDDATATVNIGAGSFSWTGNVNTAWNEPGNWACGTVPNFGDNIVIPNGMPRYPIITGGTFAVRDFVLQGGASFTMSDGSLSVHGTFTNGGSFNQSGGTISMAGATMDDIGGGSNTEFMNLSLGASGARLVNNIRVHGLLSLGGPLDVNGRDLTLVSDPTGTAMVYNNGGAVQGSATVQRWIDPTRNSGPGYRHLSSPVASRATVADLAAPGTPAVVNPAYNSAANPSLVTPFPTVFSYNEQRLTGSGATAAFDYGWESPAALTDALVPGRGYTVNLAPTTLTFTGPLTTGVVSVPLTRGTAGLGWNLVGNPYPSPINWDLVPIPAGMDAAAYVYRSNGPYTGGYVNYVNGVGPASAHNIAMGQAFFVRASSGTPTLTFNNPQRVTTLQNPALYRTQETRPLLALSLQAPAAAGTAPLEDVLYVYQETGATVGFDGRFDALKVQLNGGQQPTLYQRGASSSFAIQGLPTGNQPFDLPLTVNAPQAGTYTFDPQQLVNFPANSQLYLEDRQTGTWHDLRQGAYSVSLAQGLSAVRFVLHLNASRPLAAGQAKLTNADLHVYPNPATGRTVTVAAAGLTGSSAELRLVNALGQVVRTETAPLRGQLLERTLDVQHLPAGVYTLQLRTQAGTLTRKLILN